ncbi:bacteriohemerythrin [Clostridium sp.]|uniref:bacteriohemerythrin n=1 Tax=Clostridium sp. TaxID=1506 RepID=UPI002FC710CB
MFEWKDEYETGVPHIDEQHKRLFEIGNDAYELLSNRFVIDKYDKVVAILDELKDYAIYHFKFEEDYMLGIGYKKFLSHKIEHDDFIRKINDVDYSLIDEGQNEYILELLQFVHKWICEHILVKDQSYVM